MGEIVFKAFVIVLTIYLMFGFILNKICELKNDRWHNFSYKKPDEEKEYLVCLKNQKMKVSTYNLKNLCFEQKDVVAWRELPEGNEVVSKMMKNPAGYLIGKKKDINVQ